jgi:DNA replication and repair protein RecF
MFLKKLELRCFRNYTHLSFSPSPRSLIVGSNGQGKTNLLEALALLAYGRSFRVHLPESLVQEKKKSAYISAHIEKGDKNNHLQVSLTDSGKKQFWVDEKKSTGLRLSKEIPLILFSPESLVLLKGSAEHRRWWMDYWLNMQGRGAFVQGFKKALVQKNGLLRQIRKRVISGKKAHSLLESVNEVFVRQSLNLIEVRKKALQDLSVFLSKGGEALFQNNKVSRAVEKLSIEVRYVIKSLEYCENKQIEAQFKKQVEKKFFAEQEAGVSLCGAHRDDFKVFFQGKDSRYFCSQGQQRGLLLVLKMAQVLWFHNVNKSSCLLLLDDVFSEIDKHLVSNLLHFLDEIPSQIILTSVKTPSFLDRKKFQVFSLHEGALRKEKISERRAQFEEPLPF